jgi:molybdopterin molybdotransferase
MKTLTDIAGQLQGYDPNALPTAQVNEFLTHLVPTVPDVEQVNLHEALDRVLACDVISPLNVPAHDNSAMDGYAFAGQQLSSGQALQLTLVGTVLAGQAWHGTVAQGQCVQIMTGAVMPAGLDTVAPQELCRVTAQTIQIPAGVLQAGDNRRLRGEDVLAGSAALQKAQRLTPAALGLLASLNMASVSVYRRVKVAYFSTGNEILSLGQAAQEACVYDSNRYTVTALLQRWGCDVIDLGVVRDEPALLEAAFRQAAGQADAIITSGGVSVGQADHTKTMMQQLGDVAFWRIAMRPGRPMAVGRIFRDNSATCQDKSSIVRSTFDSKKSFNLASDCVLFGLPGNPVATMVTMLAFVRPALRQMQGTASQHGEPLLVQAISSVAIRKRSGRTEYQRGFVSRSPQGSLQVRTTSSNQGSGVLSSMVAANALIVLHHDQGDVSVGQSVDVMLFEGVM